MSSLARLHSAGAGAVAGVATALAFTALHHVIISDIWFSVVPMVVAGAGCGAALAWNYRVLFPTPSLRSWLGYVSLHVVLLFGLGIASVLSFEPVIPAAVLMASNEPPHDLIVKAMPLTVGYIAVSTVAIASWRGRTRRGALSTLVTNSLLLVLLGMNVSILGLVQFSSDGIGVLVEFFALLAVILYGHAGLVVLVARGARR